MPELSLQARLAKHLLRLLTRRSARLSIDQRRAWPDLAGRLRQKRHPDLAIVPATIGGVDCEWVFRRSAAAVSPLPEAVAPGEPLKDAAANEAKLAPPEPPMAGDVQAAEAQAEEAQAEEAQAAEAQAEAVQTGAAAADDAAPVAPTAADGQAVIIYFHGGGYVTGSLLSARVLSTNLAFDMPVRLLSVNYRLAPEHPFPAALIDAVSVYDALLADGWAPARIGMIGDSAGGGLALAAAMAIRDRGMPLPACLALISPWTDLTGRSPSFSEKADEDVMLVPEEINEYAQFYAGGNRPDNPYMSPVYGHFENLPPMLIHAGSDELLLDDARRVVEAARAAGVDATLKIWPGLFHVFSLAADLIPESRESMGEITAFLCSWLGVRPEGELSPNDAGQTLQDGNGPA